MKKKMAREYEHTTNYFYSSPVAFLVFGGPKDSSFNFSLVLAVF
jgi:hypothetical protein